MSCSNLPCRVDSEETIEVGWKIRRWRGGRDDGCRVWSREFDGEECMNGRVPSRFIVPSARITEADTVDADGEVDECFCTEVVGLVG